MWKLHLIFLLFFSVEIFAQKTESLWCHELGREQGLSSQDYNFYVSCDSENFSWISSTKGLNRFDGHQVKQYRNNTQDPHGLFGENIQSKFYEDHNKDLWFCTYQAVHRYNRNTDDFDHFFVKEKDEILEEGYAVFFLEKNQYLWFRAGKQIHRVDISVDKNLVEAFEKSQPITSTDNYHLSVGTYKDGSVKYIFSFDHKKKEKLEVFKFEADKLKEKDSFFQKEKATKYSGLSIFQIEYEDERNIWLATELGLLHWNMIDNTFREFDLPNTEYCYITPYGSQYLIVSIYQKGIFLLDKKSGKKHTYHLASTKGIDQQIPPLYKNIYLDHNHVLWVSIRGAGVYYAHLKKKKFDFIALKKANENNRNFSNLVGDEEYEILLGYEQGFIKYNTQEKTIKDVSGKGLPVFKYIYKDFNNSITWVATVSGVYWYDEKKEVFNLVKNSKNINFLRLHQLKNGNLIASSHFTGIYQIKQKDGAWEVQNMMGSNNTPAAYTSIYQDENGKIYACKNEAGIEVFTYGNELLHHERQLQIRGAVHSFYEEEKSDKLWIGTAFGLVKLNKNDLNSSAEIYTMEDGLPDNNVLSIIGQSEKKLWLSTNKGLTSFDPEEKYFHQFSLADGMGTEQYLSDAVTKLQDGSISFGTKEGVTIIPAQPIKFIETPPKIMISDILVHGEIPDSIFCKKTNARNVDQIKHLEYDYLENTLTFNVAASEYADPEKTNLRYKLKGWDEKWVDLKKAVGKIRYPNLPNGEYELVLEGTNSDRVKSSIAQRSLGITILPPFWKTWWFRSLVSFFLIAAIFFAARYRVRQIKEKEQMKTKIAENKMKALVAQMNPHFVFNSLQSINRFILKENRQQATEYLGRFAGLIRLMLNNSRETQHSLEAESSFLDLYLQVEAQRFDPPFQYSITIDDAVDQYNTEIPTMLLQPFVENAIWHGISHKKERGHISIKMDKVGEMLRCTVEDDGVGRKRAAELALEKGKTHQSTALKIVKERLQLLFPEQADLCSIKFLDLKNELGEDCGTRVTISLPLD